MNLIVDTIPFDQAKSAFSNLKSVRKKLWNEQRVHPERVDALQELVNEVEFLLDNIRFGLVTRDEWFRIQEIVTEHVRGAADVNDD